MSEFSENENVTNNENQNDNLNQESSTIFSNPSDHKKKSSDKKKRSRLTVIISSFLAIAILVGGTIAVIKLIPEKEDGKDSSETEEIKVLDLESKDFKTVTVTNKNGVFKMYSKQEKKDSSSSSSDTSSSSTTVTWYLEGYADGLINSYSLNDKVGSVASISASREITTKSASDCGLDNPIIKVDVSTNDNAEFSVLIGNKSPDNTGTYLKLSTNEKIYIVEDTVADGFEFDAISLANSDAIPGITLTDKMADYKDKDGKLSSFDSITVKGKNFEKPVIIVPNTDKNLSQYAAYMTISPTKRIADHIDDIFNLFKTGVTVDGAYSFDVSTESLKKLKLDNPDFEASIKVADYSITYKISLQDDGSYAIWYNGCNLIKKVSSSNLPYINYSVNNFYASWVCLQSINDLSNFTIKTKDKTYSFDIKYDESKDSDEQYTITYEGKKLVASNFQDFYQQCISLACTDYTVDKLGGDPDMSIVFSYKDTARSKSTVEFRKASETKYQYNVDGIDMGKITSSSLNKVIKYVEKVAAGEKIK